MSNTVVPIFDFSPTSGLGNQVAEILTNKSDVLIRYEAVAEPLKSASDLSNLLCRRLAAQPLNLREAIVFLVLPPRLCLECRQLVAELKGRLAPEQLMIVADTDDPDQVLAVLKTGVAHCLTPPLKPCEILPAVWRSLEFISEADDVTQTLKARLGLRQFIGTSPSFCQVMEKLPMIARCNANVLLTGESGTGKEMYARAIHHLGPRQRAPFVPLNCGAIPPELIENEFFGHARGAYTGAETSQTGLLEEANGGTLFLDEIDALPLTAQVKLLRVLQEKEYRSLGSVKVQKVDVRFIAATNAQVNEAVSAGKFRPDLFYRLNVIPVNIPPLRERRADIALLAQHFLKKYADEFDKPLMSLTDEATRRLLAYDWPGNVRELENYLERAVALGTSTVIQAHDLDLPNVERTPCTGAFRIAKEKFVEQFERDYIRDLLRAYAGNVTQAAQAAEKNRRAFWELMRKYDIDASQFRSAPSAKH